MLELEVLNCDSAFFLLCAVHEKFHWFFSTVSLLTMCQVEYISLTNNLIYSLLKQQPKQSFLFSIYEKNLSVFNAVKKINVYYDKNWLHIQQRLFFNKRKIKGQCYSDKETVIEIGINTNYGYNLLYLRYTIYCMSNFFSLSLWVCANTITCISWESLSMHANSFQMHTYPYL